MTTHDLNYKIGGFSGPGGLSIFYGTGLTQSTATSGAGSNLTPDLGAFIEGVEATIFPGEDILSGYYVSQTSSGNGLIGNYRAVQAGEATLSGFITGFGEAFLSGYYRPTLSGELGGLVGSLEAIPPVELLAELTGVTGLDLFATVSPIAPEELSASVNGLSFLTLGGSIDGEAHVNLGAEFVVTNVAPDLKSTLSGIGKGVTDLTASVQGFRGIEESSQLRATLVLSESITLTGSIEGFTPASLSGFYEPVPPVDLFAIIDGKDPGRTLEASVSGLFADSSLFATIDSQGGHNTLAGYVVPTERSTSTLPSNLEGIATSDLLASYGVSPQLLLNADVTATGINRNALQALITPTQVIELNASYTYAPSANLLSQVTPIPGRDLGAIITPKVFYVDSSIPINTFPFKELRATINATGCSFNSFFSDLRVYINGIDSLELGASVVGIAGQYAVAQDYVEILTRSSVIAEDWIFLIAEQSIISESMLPLIITTSPFKDLSASIEGVQMSSTLSGSIDPIYYSGVRNDNAVLGEWVNTKTGERKSIKIFFRGDSTEFFYSTDADKSFTSNPDTSLEIVVETYELIEQSESSLLTQKTDSKRCIVDGLQDFASIDDAIRYGIMCALSEINQELRAYIIATGGHKSLGAEIFPIDDDFIHDLGAKLNPVTNQPDLFATVTGTGGNSVLNSFIVGQSSSFTTSEFTDTLGIRYVPKLVTHGSGEVSIVLTKLLSTDSIDVAMRPDLNANIVGVALTDLGASISGTP